MQAYAGDDLNFLLGSRYIEANEKSCEKKIS
jgi:hypothetical protein